jgi:hypothetical protein
MPVVMQQIGEKAAWLFMLFAGQQRDEGVSADVIALYVYLFVIAMMLCFAWITGAPNG